MRYIQSVFFVSAVFFIIGIQSCDEGPTEEEKFLSKIGIAWKASSSGITLDDVPVNNVFKDFAITITNQSAFTTVNGNNPVWPAAGKFTLKKVSTTVGFNLLREDGVEVFIDEATDIKLVLRFSYVGQPGRTKSVGGEYVFNLEKKN